MGSIKPLPTLKNANRGDLGAYTRPKTTPILSSVHQTVNLVLLGNEPRGKIRQLHFPALHLPFASDRFFSEHLKRFTHSRRLFGIGGFSAP